MIAFFGMAIYHLSAKIIKRSAGRSSTAAAAYRAGVSILDERTGLTHDFTKKSQVDYCNILLNEHAPERLSDRQALWNHVESIEKRKDAQVAREIEIALPRELSNDKKIELVEQYALDNFVEKGMIADIALHNMNDKNPHAHIMLTTRVVNGEGFGQKNRNWNGKELLQKWRKNWADAVNVALERSGFSDIKISHRSLKDQKIDRKPTKHLGFALARLKKNIDQNKVSIESAIKKFGESIVDKLYPTKADADKAERDQVKQLKAELSAIERQLDQHNKQRLQITQRRVKQQLRAGKVLRQKTQKPRAFKSKNRPDHK